MFGKLDYLGYLCVNLTWFWLFTFRVVSLDLRGYGESEKPKNPSAYTIDTAVEDVKEFIDQFG